LERHNTIRKIPGPDRTPAYVVRPDLVPADPRFLNIHFFTQVPVISPNPSSNLTDDFKSNL
jgi:hypothetical protein